VLTLRSAAGVLMDKDARVSADELEVSLVTDEGAVLDDTQDLDGDDYEGRFEDDGDFDGSDVDAVTDEELLDETGDGAHDDDDGGSDDDEDDDGGGSSGGSDYSDDDHEGMDGYKVGGYHPVEVRPGDCAVTTPRALSQLLAFVTVVARPSVCCTARRMWRRSTASRACARAANPPRSS
jgi:hypothetical protein